MLCSISKASVQLITGVE